MAAIDPFPPSVLLADPTLHNRTRTEYRVSDGPMKLERLAAIAEIASSIAVVATLGYLAVQTRQNSLAIQATVRQAMLAEDRALLFKQMDYPFVRPGAYDSETLSEEQQGQLASWLTAFSRGRENQWIQYRNGVLDEATWSSYAIAIPIVYEPVFAREYWHANSYQYQPGFVEYVNDLLGE